MASITILDLDDSLESLLRMQAADHGRSMEEEAREIIRGALAPEVDEPDRLGTAIHEVFKPWADWNCLTASSGRSANLLISGNDPARHECRVRDDEGRAESRGHRLGRQSTAGDFVCRLGDRG